jgi:hypothetical protein
MAALPAAEPVRAHSCGGSRRTGGGAAHAITAGTEHLSGVAGCKWSVWLGLQPLTSYPAATVLFSSRVDDITHAGVQGVGLEDSPAGLYEDDGDRGLLALRVRPPHRIEQPFPSFSTMWHLHSQHLARFNHQISPQSCCCANQPQARCFHQCHMMRTKHSARKHLH